MWAADMVMAGCAANKITQFFQVKLPASYPADVSLMVGNEMSQGHSVN